MLDDQDFRPKPIVLVGPEFFANQDGYPSYDFTLALRHAERLHVLWDFHFVALNTPENVEALDALTGWGAPITLGQLYPYSPDKETFRKVQRVALMSELIHSAGLSRTYRLEGLKNISSVPPEQVLAAMLNASYDPTPGSFQEALRQLTFNGY